MCSLGARLGNGLGTAGRWVRQWLVDDLEMALRWLEDRSRLNWLANMKPLRNCLDWSVNIPYIQSDYHLKTIALDQKHAIEHQSKFVNIRKILTNNYVDWMLFGDLTHS
jgi:hypothetical protein